jgi:lysozyme family protein
MTAENFQACVAFTLKYEGGKSDDPRDPGGRTMEGVTQATYDAYQIKKELGRRDVYTMGAAERDEIYRHEYWDLVNGDGLRAGEDLCVFDFAVNSGVARARDLSAVWKGRCRGRFDMGKISRAAKRLQNRHSRLARRDDAAAARDPK